MLRGLTTRFVSTGLSSSLYPRSFTIAARVKMAASAESIFDKIVSGKIPSAKVWEDDVAYAFRDISPVAPTHILIVPKVRGRLSQLQFATLEDRAVLGHLMWAAAEIARQEKLEEGFRIVINDGDKGCQTVHHLHLHLIGGKQLGWPPTGDVPK